MRAFVVVHPHPGMPHDSGFLDLTEAVRVQYFLPEASVVALHVTVLVWLPFLDKLHFDGTFLGPYGQLFSDRFRAVIHPDFLWCAPPGGELVCKLPAVSSV